WNHKYVDHVQITVAESLGIGRRGKYFEEAGSTRDMVQNHLFQLLCLVGMEPPATLNADAIRDEKVKVLHSLRPIPTEAIDTIAVRAQYAAGAIAGKAVPGYRDEPHVASDSGTETFSALRTFVDNWRWADVPFYLRTGKRLPMRATEISLHFKDVPHRLFREHKSRPSQNVVALRIQPEEGIRLAFDAKVPSSDPKVRTVEMDFDYDDSFRVDSPEAYERLLLDALLGDSTLFIRRDEVEASWTFIDPLLAGWRDREGLPLPEYVAGSWGPPEADLLLAADRRRWRRL
ncbi:MAG: glucose-6-phosphate dehydrogenase (NADP(+)), partial [Planctomycetota bacterium]|nr:glucose-6-phosphate dehydrogenase (NADP(+)) [Planctomycetota bacterium]